MILERILDEAGDAILEIHPDVEPAAVERRFATMNASSAFLPEGGHESVAREFRPASPRPVRGLAR